VSEPSPLFRGALTDRQIDRRIAAAVFGYRITEGPGGACAASTGAGADARLVEVPPVSTDLAAAFRAVDAALDAGHADGFEARQGGGPAREYRATFLRLRGTAEVPICGASANSMPRAICAALLTLYAGGRPSAPGPRRLQ
jgi:hypothetical protein